MFKCSSWIKSEAPSCWKDKKVKTYFKVMAKKIHQQLPGLTRVFRYIVTFQILQGILLLVTLQLVVDINSLEFNEEERSRVGSADSPELLTVCLRLPSPNSPSFNAQCAQPHVKCSRQIGLLTIIDSQVP